MSIPDCRRSTLRVILTAVAALTLLPTSMNAEEEQLPAAEQLLSFWVEQLGGAEQAAKITTMVSTGQMTIAGAGITGALEIVQAAPNRSKVSIDIDGMGRIISGTDGEIAWELTDIMGPRLLEGEEKEYAIRSSALSMQLLWRDYYQQAQTVGVAPCGEGQCYLVEMTPTTGGVETWWLEQSSGMLTRVELVLKTVMGEMPVTMSFDDYREVAGGVKVAFASTVETMGQKNQVTITDVAVNQKLDEGVFDPPPEVQALLGADN